MLVDLNIPIYVVSEKEEKFPMRVLICCIISRSLPMFAWSELFHSACYVLKKQNYYFISQELVTNSSCSKNTLKVLILDKGVHRRETWKQG